MNPTKNIELLSVSTSTCLYIDIRHVKLFCLPLPISVHIIVEPRLPQGVLKTETTGLFL